MLNLEIFQRLQTAPPQQAWDTILAEAWRVCCEPLQKDHAATQVANRDRDLASLDLFLATTGWDLWLDFDDNVAKTSQALKSWWAATSPGRAILVLDGLSLREVPWILEGAKERGFTLHKVKVTGAEIPPDTTPFAQALGFTQRSALENNGGHNSVNFPDAYTDCVDLPWKDCIDWIGSHKDFILWHHWPDHRLHDLSEQGEGIAPFATEVAERLTSDDFWSLIQCLTNGRKLVITSDHGYAVSGRFTDTQDQEQSKYLKDLFKSGRWTSSNGGENPWVPPIDLALTTAHGTNRFVVGRRKWKSPGGYPALMHGGLSVLEVAVPLIEIGKVI
ncbi:MAG: hypothetical protein HONDAALG_00509 [Gammaproteobacteria bacterium]|nr:hypothetical protein [Gammaproteobacteria bacterium]